VYSHIQEGVAEPLPGAEREEIVTAKCLIFTKHGMCRIPVLNNSSSRITIKAGKILGLFDAKYDHFQGFKTLENHQKAVQIGPDNHVDRANRLEENYYTLHPRPIYINQYGDLIRNARLNWRFLSTNKEERTSQLRKALFFPEDQNSHARQHYWQLNEEKPTVKRPEKFSNLEQEGSIYKHPNTEIEFPTIEATYEETMSNEESEDFVAPTTNQPEREVQQPTPRVYNNGNKKPARKNNRRNVNVNSNLNSKSRKQKNNRRKNKTRKNARKNNGQRKSAKKFNKKNKKHFKKTYRKVQRSEHTSDTTVWESDPIYKKVLTKFFTKSYGKISVTNRFELTKF
jgi:hypothetical protein